MFKPAQKLIFITILGMLAACTRPSQDDGLSAVKIRMPTLDGSSSKMSSRAMTLPSGKSACYGIQVSGSGITSTPATSCAPALGSYSGFVAEGQTLTVLVARGDNRKFDLYIDLVNTGDPCPGWNETFNSTGSPFSNMYLAATVTQSITKDEESVVMTASLPASTVAANAGLGTCGSSASNALHGMLMSNGDLLNAAGTPFVSGSGDPSHPTLQSFFKTQGGASDVNGLQKMNTANVLDLATPLDIPPYIHSITKRPDTGDLFGLQQDGTIVKIDGTTGVLTNYPTGCPLNYCSVPVWIQSISAGPGGALYALDNAGQIYSVDAAGTLSLTGDTVNPAVWQVSYY